MKVSFLVGLLCISLSSYSQVIRFVKPVSSGLGDGTSWANASGSISAMLNVSVADEIWVAAGTYKPNSYPTGCSDCTSSRDYVFLIPGGKKLIGGFSGTESSINQRNIVVNETILSGDIGVVGLETDNVYHVLLSAFPFGDNGSVEVDGFTVTGGYGKNASGTISVNSNDVSRVSGSGASFIYGNKTVKNCTFTGNKGNGIGGAVFAFNSSTTSANFENSEFLLNESKFGGAIYVFAGIGNMTNCNFNDNMATINGGAIGTEYTDQTNISTCSFLHNSATMNGGAMRFRYSEAHVLACSFESNDASNYGGAIYNGYSDLLLETSYFNLNTSKQGGAVELYYDDATVRENFFESNSTTQYTGGAIHTTNTESQINQNVFYDNYGFIGGGALGIGGNVSMHSNLFYANSAKYWGAAIYLLPGTLRTITNNTFVKNSATNYGAAVYTHSGENSFYNNIFWENDINGNTGNAYADYYNYQGTNLFKNNAMQLASSTYTVTSTGARHLGANGSGNTFAANPLFKDPLNPKGADNLYRTSDDGYQLLSTSPLKNALSINPPTQDITGANRDGSPDWGAYEYGVSNYPEMLSLTGSISTSQKANLSLSTNMSNLISSGTSVTYQAGNYIQLNPSFSTGSNAIFMTKLLGGCQ